GQRRPSPCRSSPRGWGFARPAPYSSRTSAAVSQNPVRLWAPSQNGFFSDWPQRHSANGFFGGSTTLPSWSSTVISPRTRSGPFFLMVIVVGWGVSALIRWWILLNLARGDYT